MRLPLEGQKELLAELGWDTVPTACQLMARMVERAEEETRYYDQLAAEERANAVRAEEYDRSLSEVLADDASYEASDEEDDYY